MKKESLYEKLRKKFVWVPLASIAAICTIIMTVHQCTHDDKSQEIVRLLEEMRPPLTMQDLPDSLLSKPIIVKIRNLQDKILVMRRTLSSVEVEPAQGNNPMERANKYADGVFKIINTGERIQEIMLQYGEIEQELKPFNLSSISSDLSGWERIQNKYQGVAEVAKTATINASPTMPAKDKEKALKKIMTGYEVKDFIETVSVESRAIFEELNAIQIELKSKL